MKAYLQFLAYSHLAACLLGIILLISGFSIIQDAPTVFFFMLIPFIVWGILLKPLGLIPDLLFFWYCWWFTFGQLSPIQDAWIGRDALKYLNRHPQYDEYRCIENVGGPGYKYSSFKYTLFDVWKRQAREVFEREFDISTAIAVEKEAGERMDQWFRDNDYDDVGDPIPTFRQLNVMFLHQRKKEQDEFYKENGYIVEPLTFDRSGMPIIEKDDKFQLPIK